MKDETIVLISVPFVIMFYVCLGRFLDFITSESSRDFKSTFHRMLFPNSVRSRMTRLGFHYKEKHIYEMTLNKELFPRAKIVARIERHGKEMLTGVRIDSTNSSFRNLVVNIEGDPVNSISVFIQKYMADMNEYLGSPIYSLLNEEFREKIVECNPSSVSIEEISFSDERRFLFQKYLDG